MRRILGVVLVGLAFFALTAESSSSCANNNNGGGGGSSNSSSSNNSNSAATKAPAAPKATQATQAPPALGDVLKVGDLDLTLSNPRPFDSKPFNQFNTQDYAVDVAIADTRGDKYSFIASSVKIIDTNGVVHDGSSFCTSCPGALANTDLVKGGHASGTVFFKMAGATPKELDYQAFASNNKVAIPLIP